MLKNILNSENIFFKKVKFFDRFRRKPETIRSFNYKERIFTRFKQVKKNCFSGISWKKLQKSKSTVFVAYILFFNLSTVPFRINSKNDTLRPELFQNSIELVQNINHPLDSELWNTGQNFSETSLSLDSIFSISGGGSISDKTKSSQIQTLPNLIRNLNKKNLSHK
jgi:hypothetical protein